MLNQQSILILEKLSLDSRYARDDNLQIKDTKEDNTKIREMFFKSGKRE